MGSPYSATFTEVFFSFHKCPSAFCVPGTVLGAGEIATNKSNEALGFLELPV